MALSYCEICGVLIKGEGGLELPEGVICDGCYESRQVEIGTSTDDEEMDEFDLGALVGPAQFECVYCQSLLRLPLPPARHTPRQQRISAAHSIAESAAHSRPGSAREATVSPVK